MLQYRNAIPVAAHRGNSRYFPENTLTSFQSALDMNADMLEIDLHMTKDGEIILMHDHLVDRTTDGHGLIREKTLAEIRTLDAGNWKGTKFRDTQVPTFREFLDLVRPSKDMLFNVELKDYPADSGNFAYESAKKSIDMLVNEGMLSRCVINTWSGELNEWLKENYGDAVQIHAYFPQTSMGLRQKRFVLDYAYCICLFGTKQQPVVDKMHFDAVKAYGVEPWVYYTVDTAEQVDASLANGAQLFTSNDPKWLMDYLRQKGLHD